ncbi:MAG TPA: YfiR family protein, partial [Methylophilaceae bacterium]|nr:YfiR family protein [Methylophilaceae bacterium]
MQKPVVYFWIWLLALALWPVQGSAIEVGEYELKTAYLYNFALFTTWPETWGPEAGKTMAICTIGDDQFGTAIEQLHGRVIRGKRIVVRRGIPLEQASTCHMLYIAESEQGKLAAILDVLHGSSVLTIGEAPAYSSKPTAAGSPAASNPARCVITLFLEDKRLMFEVDA